MIFLNNDNLKNHTKRTPPPLPSATVRVDWIRYSLMDDVGFIWNRYVFSCADVTESLDVLDVFRTISITLPNFAVGALSRTHKRNNLVVFLHFQRMRRLYLVLTDTMAAANCLILTMWLFVIDGLIFLFFFFISTLSFCHSCMFVYSFILLVAFVRVYSHLFSVQGCMQ